MKRIITASLLLAGSLTVSAQKIELGLNGGVTPYVYADQTFKNFNGTVKQEMGYYASLRVALNLMGWQLGAAVDKFQTGVTQTSGISTNTKFNSLTPYLFVNKIFKLPKSYIYAGLNGGMNIGTAETDITTLGVTIPEIDYSGYNGGVQAGYTINFFKGLGANIEAGARYLHIQYENMPTGGKGMTVNHIAFPISLGVRYTF
jgi:hypothetical protein